MEKEGPDQCFKQSWASPSHKILVECSWVHECQGIANGLFSSAVSLTIRLKLGQHSFSFQIGVLAAQRPATACKRWMNCSSGCLQLRSPLVASNAGQQNCHGKPNEPRTLRLAKDGPIHIFKEDGGYREDGLKSNKSSQGSCMFHCKKNAHVHEQIKYHVDQDTTASQLSMYSIWATSISLSAEHTGHCLFQVTKHVSLGGLLHHDIEGNEKKGQWKLKNGFMRIDQKHV